MEKRLYPLYKMETCRFKREENGEWEVGLLFNEGSGIILDKFGEKAEQVYDYNSGLTEVSIPVDLFLIQEQKYLDFHNEAKTTK